MTKNGGQCSRFFLTLYKTMLPLLPAYGSIVSNYSIRSLQPLHAEHQMPSIDESENFDLKSALARFSQDHELLDEAIAIFKEEAPKHLEGIKTALEKNALKEASTSAHTLKSECGAVGAVKAQSVSLTMERTTGKGHISEAIELYPQLEKMVIQAIETLPESTMEADQ